MAITFEEKSYLGRNIAIVLAMVSFVVVGFLAGWNFLQNSTIIAPVGPDDSATIDKKALEDPYLAELDTFPEIVPVENEAPRQNPFVAPSPAGAGNAVDAGGTNGAAPES